MRTFLVLGGSGFIGSHLVKKLMIENRVIIADRMEPKDLTQNENVEFMCLNFSKNEDFEKYLHDVNVVIHLISTVVPENGTDNINEEIEANIFPTIKLLDEMVKAGTKEILFVSSGGTVYGEGIDEPFLETSYRNPICKYAVHKMMIEQYMHLYKHYHGIEYKVVRLSNPYGINARLNKKQGIIPIIIDKAIKNEKMVIWGDGKNERDYIFIDDAVDGIYEVLKYNGGKCVFNIGFGESHNLNQILQIIKRNPNLPNVSVEHEPERLCDVEKNVLNVDLARRELGWSAKIDLESGIERLINQMVSQ